MAATYNISSYFVLCRFTNKSIAIIQVPTDINAVLMPDDTIVTSDLFLLQLVRLQ